MKLTTKQAYELLGKHGCYVTEICDKCGQLLDSVRFTRRDRCGVWCSRKCRDGKKAHGPGTCWNCGASLAGLRRGTRFCSGTCRKRENRKLQTHQISRDQRLKTQSLQRRVSDLPTLTHSSSPKDTFRAARTPKLLDSEAIGGIELDRNPDERDSF